MSAGLPSAALPPAISTVNSQPATMRIVVIGDLHTYSLWAWPWELMDKTLTGQMNLWFNRRHRFDRSLIAPTIARAVECRPDLVLMSGDLTTTSRPREFASIADALAPLLSIAPVVILPGNHDRYTLTAQLMRRIERALPACVPGSFPCTRDLIGRWRLLAVDASVPRFFDSRGQIGNKQLCQAREFLQSIAPDEGVIVLAHYPIGKPPHMSPMKTGHRLLDETEWRDTLATCRGRVISIHGHVHCPWLWRPEIAGVNGPLRMLDINAGAPTMVDRDVTTGRPSGPWPRGQGFWEIELPAEPSQPITLTHHTMDGGQPPFGFDPEAAVVQQSNSRWVTRTMRTLV